MLVLDFETFPIEPRPSYPPKPVGVAVRFPTGRQEYLAWGHPDSDPSLERAALDLTRDAFAGKYGPVLMHNAQFDIAVAQKWAGVGMPASSMFHDTQLLSFLHDPRGELALKPLAQKLLGEAPEERDAVKDYVLAQKKAKNPKFIEAKPSTFGAYIAYCPEKLIRPYAIGDVSRTSKLFRFYEQQISWADTAYQREKLLLPVTMDMERVGVRVRLPSLRILRSCLRNLREDKDKLIYRRLGYTFNVSSGEQLAEALEKNRALTRVTLTPGGKQSTARDTLIETCSDKVVLRHLILREIATKYLEFVEKWIEKGERDNGFIHPSFHQVRSMEGGTRTGRYSSSDPNFQQVPTNSDESKNAEHLLLLAKELEKYGLVGFTGLRAYILPDPGKYWASIDYSQQELRMFAHYEGGKLAEAYRKNPKLDVHNYCRDLIREATGVDFKRKYIKTLVFGVLYGMGIELLSKETGLDLESTNTLRNGLYKALPGIRELSRICAAEGNSKAGMFTFGGRRYHTQDAALDEQGDVIREYGYKQLNIKIQGGCADMTKDAMIRVKRLEIGRIALQVHDELDVMVSSRKDAQRIAEVMCEVDLKVPVLADIKMSKTSWGAVR